MNSQEIARNQPETLSTSHHFWGRHIAEVVLEEQVRDPLPCRAATNTIAKQRSFDEMTKSVEK